MHNYHTRVTLHSSIEGVRFTVRKLTEGRRIRLNLELADYKAKLRDIVKESQAIEEAAAGNFSLDQADKLALFNLQLHAIMQDHVNPAWIRAGLLSIEGMEFDGVPASVESLIEYEPPTLYGEILAAIRKEGGLSEEEQKNSEPLTTSVAPEVGGMKDTSATPVDATGFSGLETVNGIFLVK